MQGASQAQKPTCVHCRRTLSVSAFLRGEWRARADDPRVYEHVVPCMAAPMVPYSLKAIRETVANRRRGANPS